MSDSAFINKAILKFDGLESVEHSLVEEALKAYHGVRFAKVHHKKPVIHLGYDVQLTTLEELLALLAELGLRKYDRGLWWRWRWQLAKQVEKNIQDNAAHVPHCCGKAPPSARRR